MNGRPKRAPLADEELQRGVDLQAEAFKARGDDGYDLSEDLAKRYGVKGDAVDRALFVRGLPVPAVVRQHCIRL